MSISRGFNDYYEKNINWLDDAEVNVEEMLRSFCGEYYTNDKPDFALLKQGITENRSRAKDCFKSLFKLDFKTSKSSQLSNLDIIKNIEKEFGNKIYAHGVEESKGGQYNLLMMSIADRIRVPAEYWGFFRSGMPNISPLCHGPYYIIASINKQKDSEVAFPTLREIEYILVPFSENKDLLEEASAKICTLGMIDWDQHELFCKKLIDYASFYDMLKRKFAYSPATEEVHVPSSKPVNKRPSLSSSANANDDSTMASPSQGSFKKIRRTNLNLKPLFINFTPNEQSDVSAAPPLPISSTTTTTTTSTTATTTTTTSTTTSTVRIGSDDESKSNSHEGLGNKLSR